MRIFIPAVLAACSIAASASGQDAGPRPGADRAHWATAEAIETNLAAAVNDENARHAFLTAFLNGEVWVRVDEETPEVVARLQQEGRSLRQVGVFAGDLRGRTVIFAFTRPELAPAAFGREVPLLGMSGEAALRLQSQYGVSLNYNSGASVIFSPEEIAALLASIQYRPATEERPTVP